MHSYQNWGRLHFPSLFPLLLHFHSWPPPRLFLPPPPCLPLSFFPSCPFWPFGLFGSFLHFDLLFASSASSASASYAFVSFPDESIYLLLLEEFSSSNIEIIERQEGKKVRRQEGKKQDKPLLEASILYHLARILRVQRIHFPT